MPLPADARLYALVPAAGSGERMAASLPKQYLTLRGSTVAEHTLSRLLSFAPIEQIVVATSASDLWWPQLGIAHSKRIRSVLGGETRAHSVLNGLMALKESASERDWVLVHDMARPCVRLSDIETLIRECANEGAILAAPISDTVKRAGNGSILATVPRQQLWRALTPQLFPIYPLFDALQSALAANAEITDEASAMERAGVQPRLVAGHPDNIKITVPADLPLAAFYLDRQTQEGLS
ncbi:MAG: 2-C-methyl-D-erythritol 4-phosphate cytidylyltransferase [Alcanivoracaceae bacterium]|nr:2-C-methyl-D-erythritol 4-phosphate cytidylyltransferase [Alcanivoracaceae bacterium]